MKIIIDRFEGEYAICEILEKSMVKVPKILLGDASEGDVIDISVDKDATAKRKEKVQKLMNNIWAD